MTSKSRRTRTAAATSTRPDGGPMLAKCDAPETARSVDVPAASAIVSTPEAPAGRQWSVYQRAIFADAAEGEGHTVVRARAGTGKTKRAFVLTSTFQARRSVEEANLWYVAVTRAQKSLYLVR